MPGITSGDVQDVQVGIVEGALHAVYRVQGCKALAMDAVDSSGQPRPGPTISTQN
jgi:hypothetical protein